jgi:uncharacterized protein (DUF433 family)
VIATPGLSGKVGPVFTHLDFAGDSPLRRGSPVIHRDVRILGGTPVFVGTRVPIRNLIDYLERGHSLDDFLDAFPSVTRNQAIAVLDLALEALSASAHSA